MASLPEYVVVNGSTTDGNLLYTPDLEALQAFPVTQLVPRYLYRAVSTQSRGSIASQGRGFISEARTSLCAPPSPFVQSKSFVDDTWKHLRAIQKEKRRRFHSPYVSFSASFLLVLGWAHLKLFRGESNVEISVLDLRKVHSPAIVLPAQMLTKIVNKCLRNGRQYLREDSYGEEYLVYDTITAAPGGITTFLFNHIIRQGLTIYLPALSSVLPQSHWHGQLQKLRNTIYACPRPLDVQSQTLAVNIARMFPDNFVLPILVQLLAMRGPNTCSDELLVATLMSRTGAFECSTERYVDFLPAWPMPPFIQNPPAGVPELWQEAALLMCMFTKFVEEQNARARKQLELAALRQGLRGTHTLFGALAAKVLHMIAARVLRANLDKIQAETNTMNTVSNRMLQLSLENVKHAETGLQQWVRKVEDLARRGAPPTTKAVSVPRKDNMLGRKRSFNDDDDDKEDEATKRCKITPTE